MNGAKIQLGHVRESREAIHGELAVQQVVKRVLVVGSGVDGCCGRPTTHWLTQ